MDRKPILPVFVGLLFLVGCHTVTVDKDYTQYVNPFIGTGGHGHTYPGAVVPNGMKLAEVVRVINDIAQEVDVVGLTVAEPMPRVAIRIREMLAQLPLLK